MIQSKSVKMSTRKMALTGVLGGFSVVLSMTPLGYLPIPILGVNATMMHIPVIIAALMAGPMAGTIVGLVFGVSSFMRATPAFFSDPLVSILPRLLIGVISYYSYKAFKHPVAAAITGTAANTLGVMSMVYLRGYLPRNVVIGIASINGTAEIIVSSLIVYAIAKALKNHINQI